MQQPQLPELQGALGALLGAAPPVTVMVPYPIIIPLPIPIPVPLPIVDFYKAHLTPDQRKRYDEERSVAAAGRQEEQPQPLDCSKAKSELELEQEQDEDEEMKHAEQQEKEEQEQHEQQQQPDSQEEQQQQPDSVEELDQELKSIPKTTPSPSTCNSPATDSTGTGREEATHCIVVHNVEPADSNDNATACSEKLPKIKITRLQTKRTLIQTKEAAAAAAGTPTSPAGSSNSSSATAAAECSRPLRKRKRIIDCDFQKIALRDLEAIDTHKQSNNNNSSSNNGNKEEEDIEDVCNMNGNNNSAKATKK